MKKIILGIIMGIASVVAVHTFAQSINVPWYQVDSLNLGSGSGASTVHYGYIVKSYDENDNTVCYTFSGGGISCLKNQ